MEYKNTKEVYSLKSIQNFLKDKNLTRMSIESGISEFTLSKLKSMDAFNFQMASIKKISKYMKELGYEGKTFDPDLITFNRRDMYVEFIG